MTVTTLVVTAAQRLWQPQSAVVLPDFLFFSQQSCDEALAEESNTRHGDPRNKVTSAKLVNSVNQPRLITFSLNPERGTVNGQSEARLP
jgi:hypothetical protein